MARKRIAIVGGGPAGLATAFFLTQTERWQEAYEITVYQLGWRLGGKGATGRNAELGDRIEEHGIHGFCRFYFNTWQMLRTVYEDEAIKRESRLWADTLTEAFGSSSFFLTFERVGGELVEFENDHPNEDGAPWDDESLSRAEISKQAIVDGLVASIIRRLDKLERQLVAPAEVPPHGASPPSPAGDGSASAPPSGLGAPWRAASALAVAWRKRELARRIRATRQRAQAVQAEFAAALVQVEAEDPQALEEPIRHAVSRLREVVDGLNSLVGRLRDALRRQQRRPPAQLEQAALAMDFLRALVQALEREEFWRSDFDVDRLDAHDFRDWLQENYEVSEETLSSAMTAALPSILFSFEGADTTRAPKLSAATWLNWMLRGFIGRGHYYHWMKVGTGESVMLPLYLYLRDRGVKFEFFHRLTGVESGRDGDNKVVQRLIFERQATVDAPRGADGAYEPLRVMEHRDGEHVRQRLVWPNAPDWNQLARAAENIERGVDYEAWPEQAAPGSPEAAPVHGEVAPVGVSRRSLERGAADDGFEAVVWAIPPTLIEKIGDSELKATWRDIAESQCTATRAAQIWFTKSTTDMGWKQSDQSREPVRYACANFGPTRTAFVAFDDLIAKENWPVRTGPWPVQPPRGLIYFCAQFQPLSGMDSRPENIARVLQSTSTMLRVLGRTLDGAVSEQDTGYPHTIDFDLLYGPPRNAGGTGRTAPENAIGEQRLAYQYFRANTRPTEAYVQAPPGTTKCRRYAWESGYANVVLAGDWTYTGVNAGAFESAITGGRLAAFALSGHGSVDDILGFGLLQPTARADLQNACDKAIIPMLR